MNETVYVIFKAQFDFALEVWFNICDHYSCILNLNPTNSHKNAIKTLQYQFPCPGLFQKSCFSVKVSNVISSPQQHSSAQQKCWRYYHAIPLCIQCKQFRAHWSIITKGDQYVMKTAKYIPKFYIYTLHNCFH